MASSVCTDLTILKGVGPRVAEKLARLKIHCVEDILFHFPFRYEDRTRVTPIGNLCLGDQAVIQGEVQLSEIKFGRRRMLLVHLGDGTGMILLRFFHFNARQKETFERGVRIQCYGEVRKGQRMFEMVHPEYKLLTDEGDLTEVQAALTPIYSTTEGLHQLTMRQLSEQALDLLKQDRLKLNELLPEEVLTQNELPELIPSIEYIHRPPPDAPVKVLQEREHIMQERFAIEELLAHTSSLRLLRNRNRQHAAHKIETHQALYKKLLRLLPFKLTKAQQRVIDEINIDLKSSTPMQRLVQGDVGSGKTMVAVAAALQAVEAGFQVAIMAPTEILAEQHFKNMQEWFAQLDVTSAWLTGKLKAKPRREALEAIATHAAQVVVGTHALFQDEVEFAKLGLVVIDEQHRFGVHQRLALREKGRIENGSEHIYPHQLIMTATPIPRTLAMTVYADLDVSIIDELPPGRKPIETVVIPDSRRDEIVQRVHKAVAEGRQIYWVCSLIEESEALQCQAAEDTANLLSEALPDVRIGLVHGRLKPEQKEQVMDHFKRHELDLIVATTVIEVGVDVPNASLMVIENAERFGLSQLHQLRGRVGRGTQDSVCVLMYHGGLSQNARERLAVMRKTNDGFEIAQKDLELRGPGEVLGTRQTGEMQMMIADMFRHQHLLPIVNRWADELVNHYPQQTEKLIQRWVGEDEQFANV